MASAVVRSGPEPERLARTKAAAHTEVERGMVTIIMPDQVELGISKGSMAIYVEACWC
jgi:hypothetical protein